MKPVSVITHWSEAGGELDRVRAWDINDFDRVAETVARNYQRGGYLKTMVTVVFDDSTMIELRLDLAPDDSLGVRHHIKRYQRWLETDDGRADYARSDGPVRKFYDYMKTVDLEGLPL